MGFIILTRNPRNKKLIAIVNDPGGEAIAEFDTEAEALDAASNTTVCRGWGYQVVEVDRDATSK